MSNKNHGSSGTKSERKAGGIPTKKVKNVKPGPPLPGSKRK